MDGATLTRPTRATHSDQIGHRATTPGATWTTVQAALDRLEGVVASGGAADETTSIQAQIDALGAGHTLRVGAGTHLITGTLTLPSNFTLEGDAGCTLRGQAGRTTPLIDIDGKINVTVRGFTADLAAGTAASSLAYAVYVRGNAFNVKVEDVRAAGWVTGVQIDGSAGFVSGTCRKITVRDCDCDNSPTSWGLNAEDCDVVLFDNCGATGNWLDGGKARATALNVTVRGGRFNGNGIGYLSNPSLYAGDGWDGYAGANGFTLDGAVCDGNYGNGITIKSGDLNKNSPSVYGYVRNVRLLNVSCRNNLQGSGAYLTIVTPGDLAEPLVTHLIVDGGDFDENSEHGIYCSTRNTTIDHPHCRNNQKHGIVTSSRAMDVQINDPVCVGNGRAAANTYSGINVDGRDIVINGGLYVGRDADTIGSDADYTGTLWSRHGIDIAAAAFNIAVHWPTARHLVSQTVRDLGTTGRCIINQIGTGDPNASGRYGGMGSMYIRDYTGGGGANDDGYLVVWIKTAGLRNTPTSGWSPMIPFAPVAALPTAIAALRGTTLRKVGGAGVADSWHVCQKNAADAYEWKQITVF